VEIRDLQYFAVVAEHANVTRASEALALSPPALSMSLRRLEKSIGAKVVERTPKGVKLTAAGAALLAHVRRLRLTLQDMTREVSDLGLGRAGRLRIGLSQVDDEELLAACPLLLRDAPKLSLEFSVSNNDVLVPRLREGDLDIIINLIPPSPYDGTAQELLFEDQLVICASATHRLAKRKRLTMADLAEERWALGSPDIAPNGLLYQAFRDAGLPKPEAAIEARSIRIRLHSWARSNLLGITSKRFLQRVSGPFRLVQVPVKGLGWSRPVGVTYRRDGYLPPAGRRLIELLKSESRRRFPETGKRNRLAP